MDLEHTAIKVSNQGKQSETLRLDESSWHKTWCSTTVDTVVQSGDEWATEPVLNTADWRRDDGRID